MQMILYTVCIIYDIYATFGHDRIMDFLLDLLEAIAHFYINLYIAWSYLVNLNVSSMPNCQ